MSVHSIIVNAMLRDYLRSELEDLKDELNGAGTDTGKVINLMCLAKEDEKKLIKELKRRLKTLETASSCLSERKVNWRTDLIKYVKQVNSSSKNESI